MPDTVAERWARWAERHPDRAEQQRIKQSGLRRTWQERDPAAYAAAREREKAKRKERLRDDPDYAASEAEKKRAATARRLGRPVLPFHPAAPRYRQLSMMDELPDAERRLIAYAGRDREKHRARTLERARAQGVPAKGESVLDMIRRLKGSNPCMDCGVTYPFYVMQFDHRPGEAKSFILSKAKNKTRAEVEAEIAKCDLVCANCHSIRTYERVIRRPKVVRIKTCARCGSGYAGPYSEHAKDRGHIASLASIVGCSA